MKSPPIAPSAESRSALPPSGTADVPFVGRETELGVLRTCLTDARRGRGRVLLVGGEPGIGKTRFVEAAVGEARSLGFAVAQGACDPYAGTPEYWPWRQVHRALGTPEGSEPLAPTAPLWLGGELVDDPTGDPGAGGAPDQRRFRLFDGAARALARRTRREPVLLVLEDLQWADRSSLLLLEFVAPRLRTVPIVLLGTYRDLDVVPDHPLYVALAEVSRHSHTERLVLRGLEADALARFVAATAGIVPSASAVETMLRDTGGNPFFVSEVVRLLASRAQLERLTADASGPLGVPPSVREVIGQRLARLSPTGRELLELAATIGVEMPVALLASATGQPAMRVLAALEEPLAARLVREVRGDPGRWRFTHALVREVLYQALGPARRAALHHAIGEALERLHGELDGPHLDELAHHFACAAPGGSAERAVAYSARAAARAMERYGFDESARHYERALALVPGTGQRRRGELLLGHARARKTAGDPQTAGRSFFEAADLALRLGDADLLAEAALRDGLWWAVTSHADDQRAMALLEEACARLGGADSPLRAAVLAQLGTGMAYAAGQLDRGSELAADAVAMARRLGDPVLLVQCLFQQHQVAEHPDGLALRRQIADELDRFAVASARADLDCLVQWMRAIDLLEVGDRGGAETHVAACRRLADELRQPLHLWNATRLRVTCLLLEGHTAEAKQGMHDALELGRQALGGLAVDGFLAQRAELLWQQGRLEETITLLETGIRTRREERTLRCGLVLVLAEQGAVARARAQLDVLAAGGIASWPRGHHWLAQLSWLGRAAAVVGDRARAAAIYDLLAPYADRTVMIGPSFFCQGSVARGLGVLAGALERWDEAMAHFETALAVDRGMGAAPYVAFTERDREAVARARDVASGRSLPAEGLRSSPAEVPAEAAAPVFRREGNFWTISWDGPVVRLKDTRGLRYVAQLLARPGQEVHVLDLVAAVQAEPGQAVRRQLASADAGAVLDATARAAYRQRLVDLRDELEEAASYGDLGRSDRLRVEMEFLTEQLASALGVGGTARRVGGPSERARSAVTQNIRSTLKRLVQALPVLDERLARRIRTGAFCAYEPDPSRPVAWRL
jgi:tetratricopeptide (TPR) repeat protein